MSTESLADLWHYVVGLILIILTLGYAWVATRSLTKRPGIWLIAATAWLLWLAVKAGFTRHDEHVLSFFSIVIVLMLGLTLIGARRAGLQIPIVALALALLSMTAVQGSVLAPIDRGPSLHSLGNTLRALESTQYRAQLLEGARQELSTQYETISPGLRATLGMDDALVDPWDISALWGTTDTRWQPLPVMQSYSVYTPELDRLNGLDLAARPRQILRAFPHKSIDGRNPIWESPAYQAMVYCGYRIVEDAPGWQVLREAEDTVCGEVRPLSQVEVSAGEPIAVPSRSGAMTLATIRPKTSLMGRMMGIAFKPGQTWLQYGPRGWRYAHGEAATRLMLNAPVPHRSFAGLPSQPYDSLSVDHPATITFETVDVTPRVAPSDR